MHEAIVQRRIVVVFKHQKQTGAAPPPITKKSAQACGSALPLFDLSTSKPQMEPDDNSYYRVILNPDQRIVVLDAHRLGDIFFQIRRGSSVFRGQIRNNTDLPNQVALLYVLIQRFGPNQVVGVPAFGNPSENLSFERVFIPETLHSFLSLNYIIRFILIHKVPESSLPPQHTLPQGAVISGVWDGRSYRAWWPVFQRYQEGPSINLVPEERDEHGRFLRIWPLPGQDNHQE
jgi:hypothetical protein